ncbi:hypothetical protein PSN45_002774 [Yamadazyma tenuis]|uniref:Uncharacterized protein n=1 Tax=Candida tenuis (strain ATCC 10573 / BCRC 21748 / CBS 615 / JCM 9827 / NBRC 10315 / NRRL Y-1498 / VKM Y-70) TaxID=590646 RepID=G3AWT7_CANTC|nr:uncharacterized protein CANTEDRAFT_112327 [Yamadazyma tenuis ATCC 10573]EGV66615.1 hypothetical protein CANTEDRAFT_112327 [Yamadazyma tenuis ATCC 10573]WEJ95261.1 hypothetical protein PSN45_002774 [Yamadazyma tenuis]
MSTAVINTTDIPTTTTGTTTSKQVPLVKFFTHLEQYPLAVGTKEMLRSVPYLEITTKAVVPYTISLSELPGLAFLTQLTESIANGVLNQADRYIPSLKTVQCTDLSSPVTQMTASAVGCTWATKKATEMLVDTHVTQPTLKAAIQVENLVHKTVYNSEGKNKLLSPLDSVVEPLNNKMVEVVDHFKPDTKKVSKDETSSEVSRSRKIMWNFLVGEKQT